MSTPTTSLTGAALLREAARVMRNRAYDAEYDKHLGCQTEWESFRQQCLHQTVEPFAPHVAAMTPTVALAMADWLDYAATAPARAAGGFAETTARAYLGEA